MKKYIKRRLVINLLIKRILLFFRFFFCFKLMKIVSAIVGSGIGGSAAAYFIREYLQEAVHIDLFEQNKIGGRLATVRYGDEIFETGGCIIHERNKYMNEFRKKFGE